MVVSLTFGQHLEHLTGDASLHLTDGDIDDDTDDDAGEEWVNFAFQHLIISRSTINISSSWESVVLHILERRLQELIARNNIIAWLWIILS